MASLSTSKPTHPEQDKQRVNYPPRYRERQPKGWFKAGKDTSCAGKESTERCLLGVNSGPSTWPSASASRLEEAVCTLLCNIHPAATRLSGVTRPRLALILADYRAIREVVLSTPRLMAQTEIQLFELNHRTLTQWFSRRQRGLVSAVLLQGSAADPLLPVKRLSFVQVGQGQPFNYHVPAEQPGPSSGSLPPPAAPPPDGEKPGPSSGGFPPPPPTPTISRPLPGGRGRQLQVRS
ncbi:uncharacterized protein AB9W97_005360 [Spinachia spinachia]